MDTRTLKTQRQCAFAMNIDPSTLYDHRIAGAVTPAIHIESTVTLYDPFDLCEELIANGKSEQVREAARKWKYELEIEPYGGVPTWNLSNNNGKA